MTISNYRRKIRTLDPFFIDETQTRPPQGQDQVAELPSGKTQLGLWHDNDHCRRTWWKGLENIFLKLLVLFRFRPLFLWKSELRDVVVVLHKWVDSSLMNHSFRWYVIPLARIRSWS